MKLCYICGKSRMAGRTIQHRHGGKWQYRAPKKARVFKLNIRKLDIIDSTGQTLRTDVCMKCYKRLRKDSK